MPRTTGRPRRRGFERVEAACAFRSGKFSLFPKGDPIHDLHHTNRGSQQGESHPRYDLPVTSWETKAPPIATLLKDRFDFIEFLGKGGFASVYKVRRISLARTEALKVLLGKRSEDPDFARRFQQEARVAASLEHPNIVHIYDFGEAQGTFWYSMQFVDGPTITSEMKSKGPLSEESAARLSIALLDALDYSHGHGVVHRDIKPDNLILDKRGHPYLMDFGIAKSADSMVETQSGFILGSPAYLSPEQLRGVTLDGRTDVYSFGITLYEMLSGGRPFDSADPTELLIQRLRQDPIPIIAKRPDISDELAAIVMKSLERERELRFSGAAEMRDALSAFLADRTAPTSTRGTRGEADRSGSVPMPSPESETTQPTSLLEFPTGSTVKRGPAGIPPPLPEPIERRPALVVSPAPRRPLRWVPTILIVLAFGGAVGMWLNSRREPPQLDRPRQVQPTVAIPAPQVSPVPAPTPLPIREAPQATPPLAISATPVPTPHPVRTKTARTAPPDSPPARRVKTMPEEEHAEPVKLSPELAKEYAGKGVVIGFTITEDGLVKDARVMEKVSPRCDECDRAALQAVKLYRFRPARDAEGIPVENKGVAIIIRF